MDYKCAISVKLENQKFKFIFHMVIPIATLCPCSREISKFGAHNQRAEVNLKIESGYFLKIEELIRMVEIISSGELYAILKRPDEKYMTEKMYNNPKFVEDIVRDIAVQIKKNKKIINYSVACKSFESIHNHNAYAEINN